MDSLSHTLLGACLGEALLGKRIGKKAMFWGALANNFPDADVLVAPFFHPIDALFVHRGLSHSVFFIALISPLLGWIFSRFLPLPPIAVETEEDVKRKGKGWGWWTLFFLLILLAHPLLDSCTMYGTGIFEPLSNYRAQFPCLFIIDPLYTLPLLIGTTALLMLKNGSVKRKFWHRFALGASTIYLALAITSKLSAEKVFAEALKEQQVQYTGIQTAPTPLNSILWLCTAKDADGYWIGFYSQLDKTKNVSFSFIPRADSLAGSLLENYTVKRLIHFSNGYYCFTQREGHLYFNDLRFAFAGEFNSHSGKDFVFSFRLRLNPDAPYGLEYERSPWSRTRFAGLSNLLKRISGES